jgi:hypothetical protein
VEVPPTRLVLNVTPLEFGAFEGARFPNASLRVRVREMLWPETTDSSTASTDVPAEKVEGVTTIEFDIVERSPLSRVRFALPAVRREA